jgi:hypothetical protein
MPLIVTGTEKNETQLPQSDSKFEVFLPGGVRVDGLSLNDICELSWRLTERTH